ncbi:MAG TPA: DUF2007 domain-containing protein [Candidatus Sulfotelmatobacter sp.]|jgi:hypothetical protein|nr:DUF2007 domain-containing protein [Candidatus Sulfotelmatobacter sp.]
MRVKGWTEVFKGDRLHAEIISAVLDANGLRVEVFGDNAYGIGINLTEARVMVPDDDAATARRLIEEAESPPQV